MLKNKPKNRGNRVKVPNFIAIRENIISDIYKILCEQNVYFKKVLFLGDRKTFEIGGNKIIKQLKAKRVSIIKKSINKSNERTVKKVVKIIKKIKPILLIGFGGGKVLDVAKICAGKNHIKFVSIPTILSNDGIASPVSVITNKDGIPVSHLTHPPYGIIIDFSIIKKAPLRHLRAGVGDLVSNLSAVCDCRLARRIEYENINQDILELAEAGAKRLLKVGQRNIKGKEFLECLCDGLLKSGLAMCLVGSSRPASGSEHKISHSMDYLFPHRNSLHGEQVGIATLYTMALQKNPYLKLVIKLYKRIKFPTRLSYLGITPDEFVQVVLNAKKIRPRRYTILEHKTLTEKHIRNIIGMIKANR